MPMGYIPGSSRVAEPVQDTSECVVPVTRVTRFVTVDGKKYRQVSTVYETHVPRNFSTTPSYKVQNRPFRVETETFEVSDSS